MFDRAKSEFAQSPDAAPNSAVYRRAQDARTEFAEAERHVDQLRAEQIDVLKLLGKDPRTRAHSRARGGEPWRRRLAGAVADGIDLAAGRNRVDVPLGDLVTPPSSLPV